MSTHQVKGSKSARKANEEHESVGTVEKPRIVVEDMDNYYIPTELFCKSLINSPVEFGTATIAVAMEDGEYPDHLNDPPEDMRQGWTQYYELELAQHPHRGLMICGYMGRDEQTKDRMKATLEPLKKVRELLVERLQERWNVDEEQLEKIGIFVAAPGIDGKKIPAQWKAQGIYVCETDDMEVLPGRIMEAMDAQRPEEFDYQDWQYLMGAAQRACSDYTTGLQYLVTLG